MKGTVLLAGIHGVGKTTAASKLTDRFRVPSYTASQIIKNSKNSQLKDGVKQIGDVDANQQLLLSGIEKLLKVDDFIILDGHFTLLNLNSKIEKINLSVFRDLNLIGVILLTDKPSEIFRRLKNRDNQGFPKKMIELYQKEEVAHGSLVSKELNVPLILLNSYHDDDLFAAFDKLIHNDKPIKI